MNIDFKLVEKVKKLVLESYEQAKTMQLNIKNKDRNDIVTDVDIFMENKIVEKIQEWFPEHGIYSEECGELQKNSEYEWFIDPIDGTINFAAGIPLFSTSIALKKNDIYYAIKGQGAYCNGKKLAVSQHEKLSDSIISFCLTSHYNEEHIKEVLNVEEVLASQVRGLRLVVSGAIELCWCASGKIDGVLNVKPSAGISSAAGKLFVQEAGGKITNLKGENRSKVDTLLVSNGKIHEKLVEVLNY